MPQNFTRDALSAARIATRLGYTPQQPISATSPITFDGSTGDLEPPAPPPIGVASVTFGVGAPAGTPANGDLYFDTTVAIYVGYVGNGGVWNQF